MTPGATLTEFLGLVHGRQGHFLLESGFHSEMWLDLDGLFAEPRRIEPFVMALVERLRPHAVPQANVRLRRGAFPGGPGPGGVYGFPRKSLPLQRSTLTEFGVRRPLSD
jgi:hypothetical protein